MLRPCVSMLARKSEVVDQAAQMGTRAKREGAWSELATFDETNIEVLPRRYVFHARLIESRRRGVVCGLRRMRDYSSSVTVLSECEHESIACLQYESTSHGLFPAP